MKSAVASPTIRGVLETCLYVDDLDAAQAFYGEVLGMQFVRRKGNRHVFFRCGEQMLLLFDPRQTNNPDSETPNHGASGASHIALAVDPGDIARWRERLRDHGVTIEKDLQWPQGGHSLYFRDPAGNSLELATPSIWDGAEDLDA